MKKVLVCAIPAVAAVAVAMAASGHADTTLVVGGTEEVLTPADTASWFGGEFTTATTPTIVNYPASFYPLTTGPTFGASVTTGVQNLDAAIASATGPIVVIGLSQGAVVVDDEQNLLDGKHSPPPASDITFVAAADPQAPEGLATVDFPAGVYVPGLDLTPQNAPTDSPYNTTEVNYEYDPIGNAPDRPWDVLADINAIVGVVYDHTVPLVNLSTVPATVTTTVNANGGTVTNYVVSAPLPIIELMNNLGVPTSVTNPIAQVLKPIVDYGYSDLTPNAGPYINHGQLVTNPPKPTSTAAIKTTGVAPMRGEPLRPVGTSSGNTQPKETKNETALQSRPVLATGQHGNLSARPGTGHHR